LGGQNPTNPISGSTTLTADQLKMLQFAKLYVNVHTAANPGGEIRGQIAGVHSKKKAAAPAPAATAPK
jgi:hypothetical protein